MSDFWEEMESKAQVEVKVEVGEIRTGWQYQQSEMLKAKLYFTYVSFPVWFEGFLYIRSNKLTLKFKF